jgi:hypothetical protein
MGAPPQGMGMGYSAPPMGAPPAGYGAPPQGMGYGAPPAGYGAPPQGMGPPQGYGAPPQGYGQMGYPPQGGAPPPGQQMMYVHATNDTRDTTHAHTEHELMVDMWSRQGLRRRRRLHPVPAVGVHGPQEGPPHRHQLRQQPAPAQGLRQRREEHQAVHHPALRVP